MFRETTLSSTETGLHLVEYRQWCGWIGDVPNEKNDEGSQTDVRLSSIDVTAATRIGNISGVPRRLTVRGRKTADMG